jgi:hypothetical protein
MSGITGAVGPTDYGMMSSLVANAASVKQKLDQLTNQASTGLVGDTYAGLSSGASVSLDLRRSPACRPGRTTWMLRPAACRSHKRH